MKIICPVCGGEVVISNLGRKPLNIGVKNIYDALQDSFTVTEAAGKLGCSRAYIYKFVKECGISPKTQLKATCSIKE